MNKTAPFRFLSLGITTWIAILLYLGVMSWFLFVERPFMLGTYSAAYWLYKAWTPETDYEHGWMVPCFSLYLLWHACKSMKGTFPAPSLKGLWLTIMGALLCVISVRSQQGRIAIGAVPVLLTGMVWCYWGGKTAFKCAFPFFFLWLSIPLPGFQQATVGMQLLATDMAHWGASLFGVDTIVEGTNISSATGNWDTYSIVGGCSGIRSLMALFMFSVAWGYLADSLSLWKRLALGLSAIPLSILANAFRVTSIFVFAEYVNPAFAGKTWHDWSGLLFFFPASLFGLMVLHGLLAGEIPFFKKRRVVVRRHNGEEVQP